MKKINIIGFEIIKTEGNMFGSPFSAALQGFGGNHHPFSDRFQGKTDFFLTIAVHVGGIKKRDAALKTMPHHRGPFLEAQRDNGNSTKSHLRNHTCENPKKQDLCSRSFFVRGKLAQSPHYSCSRVDQA